LARPVLKSFLVASAAVYLFGVVLTGFVSVVEDSDRSLSVGAMVSETVSSGVSWPFHAYRIFNRVL
jgi:hypothetical protein